MAFCPFMSNTEEKVECDSDCALFISGWTIDGQKRSTCAFNMQTLESDSIRNRVDAIGNHVDAIRQKTDQLRFWENSKLYTGG